MPRRTMPSFLGFRTLAKMGQVLRKADAGFWILATGATLIPFLSAVYFHPGSFAAENVQPSFTPLWIWFACMFFLYNMSITRLVTSWTGSQSKPIRSFLRLMAGRIIYGLVMTIIGFVLYLVLEILSYISWFFIISAFIGGFALVFFCFVLAFLPVGVSWMVAQADADLPKYPWGKKSVLRRIAKRSLKKARIFKFWKVLLLYGLLPVLLVMSFVYDTDYVMLNALGIVQTNSQNEFEMGKSFLYLLIYVLNFYMVDTLGIVTGIKEGTAQSVEYTDITEKPANS